MSPIPSLTHKAPISQEEIFGQRVEGNVRARTLGVVVRATELRASGREAAAGEGVGGHSGPESSGSVHLGVLSDIIAVNRIIRNQP